MWRHLSLGSPLRGFSASDPLRLLARNLDFWLPPVTTVMRNSCVTARSSARLKRDPYR